MELKDKIKGTIYGQAIGDALGLATEFMSKKEVDKNYPNGIQHYQDSQINPHTERWERGEWTDDTDQMLCILDAILEHKEVSVKGVSQKFMDWYNDMPMGIGTNVYNVLSDKKFLRNPHRVSKKVWEISGKNSAANGGVMRTSILGVWQYNDFQKVEENAKKVCQITHYDPRCVASCVAVSVAISVLLKGTEDVAIINQICVDIAQKYDKKIPAIILNSPKNISDLKLNESASIGYTYKALAAGFWALNHATSFEKGLQDIILEGGDADTNASVGGALLGAKFGYDHIPEPLKSGLYNREELEERIEQLLDLMV